jgi:hypothetical protein
MGIAILFCGREVWVALNIGYGRRAEATDDIG